MSKRGVTFRLMTALIAISFICAPLSGVVPSWLGFDDGPFHVHLDHVWQGTTDQNHHAHDLNGDNKQELLVTTHSHAHDDQSAFEPNEQDVPHSHGPHMHFIDVMDSAFALIGPNFSHEQAKIIEAQKPEYVSPDPLLKPPQSVT